MKQIINKRGKSINVGVQVVLGRQDEFYVAYCPSLKLSSYGKSEEEAKKNFATELEIFLEETEKRGTLEKILLRLGWCLRQTPSPNYIPPKQTKLNIALTGTRRFNETVAIPL